MLTFRWRSCAKPCRPRCEPVEIVSTRCGRNLPDRSPPTGSDRWQSRIADGSIARNTCASHAKKHEEGLTSAISRASRLSLWKPGHTWNLPRNEFSFNNACVLVSSSSQDFTKMRSATVSFTRSNSPPTCSRHDAICIATFSPRQRKEKRERATRVE